MFVHAMYKKEKKNGNAERYALYKIQIGFEIAKVESMHAVQEQQQHRWKFPERLICLTLHVKEMKFPKKIRGKRQAF